MLSRVCVDVLNKPYATVQMCPSGLFLTAVLTAVQDPRPHPGPARWKHPGYGQRRPEQQAGGRQHHQRCVWSCDAGSLPHCIEPHRHPPGSVSGRVCGGLLSGVKVSMNTHAVHCQENKHQLWSSLGSVGVSLKLPTLTTFTYFSRLMIIA